MAPIGGSGALDRRWKGILIALAAFGLAIWATTDLNNRDRLMRWMAEALAVSLAFVPGVQALILDFLDGLRHPGPAQRWLAAGELTALALVTFLTTATYDGHGFAPRIHDEFSYLIGSHMVAQGHLWYPAHPLGKVFESFYLVTQPVYASYYFPGTEILNAPGVLFHWPTWLIPLLFSSLCVGLTYLVVCQVLDGAAGFLAAVMLLSIQLLHNVALRVFSETPTLLFALIALLLWLHWRTKPRWYLALLIGVAGGWCVICRPADALCLLAPLGVGILMDLQPLPRRQAVIHLLLMLIGVAPLLGIQMAVDKGLTGSPFRAPHEVVNAVDFPGLPYGSHVAATHAPVTALPQKRWLYELFFKPRIDRYHDRWRIVNWFRQDGRHAVGAATPDSLLKIFLPMSVLALTTRRRWVLWTSIPLFCIVFAFHPAFLDFYALALAPALCLAIILGARALQRIFPTYAPPLEAMLLTLSLAAFFPPPLEAAMSTPVLDAFDSSVAAYVHPPAIVLVKYGGQNDHPHEEIVYNFDVAWPDDAPIIRANDLGDESNEKIFKYYSAPDKRPDAGCWQFDRATWRMKWLGKVRDLAAADRIIHHGDHGEHGE